MFTSGIYGIYDEINGCLDNREFPETCKVKKEEYDEITEFFIADDGFEPDGDSFGFSGHGS
jgi:hypothetical protein